MEFEIKRSTTDSYEVGLQKVDVLPNIVKFTGYLVLKV